MRLCCCLAVGIRDRGFAGIRLRRLCAEVAGCGCNGLVDCALPATSIVATVLSLEAFGTDSVVALPCSIHTVDPDSSTKSNYAIREAAIPANVSDLVHGDSSAGNMGQGLSNRAYHDLSCCFLVCFCNHMVGLPRIYLHVRSRKRIGESRVAVRGRE